MAIESGNIFFVESQVMDDVPEGGGAATGTKIIDGQMNNVFPDISDTDRAYGRLNLRKMFLSVYTADVDTFGGAKTVVTALPTDDSLAYTLFDTGEPFDTRDDAADKVEAYLYKSTTWQGYLNENHIAGMTAISVIQKVGSALPPIGKTLCLVQNEGLVNEIEQYVRVIDVSSVETEFSDGGDKTYTRMIVTMTLSDALRFNFNGHTVTRNDSEYNYTNKTRIRDTRVANATKYYAAQPLAVAGDVGDLTIKAASMFTQLVPSAQTETPLVNKTLSPTITAMQATRATSVTMSFSGVSISPVLRFVAPTGILPSSLLLTISGNNITDDGAGNAMLNSAVIGAVVYDTGEIIFATGAPTTTGTATLTYIPAAVVSQQSHTRALQVTAENRRLNWTETLLPVPAPATLTVSYMSQGGWYVLQDDGNGNIVGTDPALGAGTISYVTGAMLVSLGALPDAGSQIMLSWASPAHYVERSDGVGIDIDRTFHFDLARSIKPNNLTVEWISGVVTKTATADVTGNITGDGTGFVFYSSGKLWIKTSFFPDAATQFSFSGKDQTEEHVTKTGVTASGGLASIAIGEEIQAGSLRCEWSTQSTKKTDSVTTTYIYETKAV